MIEPTVDHWAQVTGDDRNIPVKVNLYERHIQGCDKNGVLYALPGPVNRVYMMVEINGLLYLTRGAMFGYSEFTEEENE